MVLVIAGITLQRGFIAGLGLAVVGLLLLENISAHTDERDGRSST